MWNMRETYIKNSVVMSRAAHDGCMSEKPSGGLEVSLQLSEGLKYKKDQTGAKK